MSKVYFSVAFNGFAGLTDQLRQLTIVRKLGLSLGYTYFYKKVRCRRNLYGLAPLNLPWFLSKLIYRITYPRLSRLFPYLGIWNYLGLNQHFARQAEAQKQGDLSKYKQIKISLSDRTLKKNGISTLVGLKDYIKRTVSEENSSERPLLLNISLTYPLDSLFPIGDLIPDSIDDLDLHAIYLAHRRKRLRGSNFPKQGVKTLLHIRQGDVASVRTPWNTWIYWSRGKIDGERFWRECHDESEFDQLSVADFYRFIKGISSRFADNAFAVQVFSDGFERTFNEIYCMTHKGAKLGFTRKQMDSLLKCRRRYAREFEAFKGMKNSKLTVGEWPLGKLYKLIDAAITADLLIAAFPSQMMTFQVRSFFSSGDHPPVVLLYKPIAQKRMQDFLESNSSGKIIPVNISAPDFDRVAARLTELLPSLERALDP